MRAGWMPSGACASSSTAPPRGGTRRASGGAATTNTAYAARRSYSSGAAAEWHWARRMTGFSPASCLLRHPKVDPEAFGNLGVGACQPCGDDEPCRKSSCRLERHSRPSDPPRWGSRRRFEFFQMGRPLKDSNLHRPVPGFRLLGEPALFKARGEEEILQRAFFLFLSRVSSDFRNRFPKP